MAEADPMVQAFLKARAKNQREDVKLQRYLQNLELRKSNMKSMLDEQLFEHRRVAFELKKEADINNSQGKIPCNSDGSDSVFNYEGKLDRTPAKPTQNGNAAATGSLNNSEKTKGTIVTILYNREDETILNSQKQDVPSLSKDENGSMRPRLASAISFPPVWKTSKLRESAGTEDIGDGEEDEKLEETVPVKDKSKEETPLCWLGDPLAIGSVRRPRKSTKEVLAREDSRASLRTASRELRQFAKCSRNCGKLQFIQELERCFADIPLLLPAIIAERERQSQNADKFKRDRSVSQVSQGERTESLPYLTSSAPAETRRSRVCQQFV